LSFAEVAGWSNSSLVHVEASTDHFAVIERVVMKISSSTNPLGL